MSSAKGNGPVHLGLICGQDRKRAREPSSAVSIRQIYHYLSDCQKKMGVYRYALKLPSAFGSGFFYHTTSQWGVISPFNPLPIYQSEPGETSGPVKTPSDGVRELPRPRRKLWNSLALTWKGC